MVATELVMVNEPEFLMQSNVNDKKKRRMRLPRNSTDVLMTTMPKRKRGGDLNGYTQPYVVGFPALSRHTNMTSEALNKMKTTISCDKISLRRQ